MKALIFQCGPIRYVACKAIDKFWPGVHYSRIAAARLSDIDLPDRLPPGWARVRVHQCGLCASDVSVMRLAFSPFVSPILLSGSSPGAVVLGHELVGTVVETAAGCKICTGQRVIARAGAFRNCFNRGGDLCPSCAAGEYALCHRSLEPPPAHEPVRSGGFAAEFVDHGDNLLVVPDALDDDRATVAEPMATALRAVLALPRPDRNTGRVLVVGAGIQGLAAVHWIRHLRPEFSTACLARYPFQSELALRLGAAGVFVGHAQPAELARYLGTSTASSGRRALLLNGFDAVIDTVGTPSSLQNALDWTRPGGSVVVVGADLWPGRLDYSPVWFREVRVHGVYAHGLETFEGHRVGTLALAMELLATRAALPCALVSHRVRLGEYREAVAMMQDKARFEAVRIALLPPA